jgi:Flp pilus assembly protein TadD
MKRWMILVAVGLIFWTSPSLMGQPLPDIEAAEKRFSQGLSFYFRADYPGAVRAFEESAQLKPDEARTYYFLGYAYYEMGEIERARAAFSKAYEIDKDYQPPSPSRRAHQGRQP